MSTKFPITEKSLRGSNRKKTFKELLERPGISGNFNRPEEKKDFMNALEKKNYTKAELKEVFTKLGAEKNSISKTEAMRASRDLVKGVNRAEMRKMEREMAKEDIPEEDSSNKEKQENKKAREIEFLKAKFGSLGGDVEEPINSSTKDVSEMRGKGLNRPLH